MQIVGMLGWGVFRGETRNRFAAPSHRDARWHIHPDLAAS
jgi:hypothetical protein